MAFESLARTLRKTFYLKHLLATLDVLAYIFTPICSVPYFPSLPALNKKLVLELARCEFIDRRENAGTG